MKIGSVHINGNAVLAPIAGYTDVGFRAVCSECGASAVYTEMVSAKGLIYDSGRTKDLLYTQPQEKVSCVQIFGEDPYYIQAAAEHEALAKFAILDINMGCPVPKIVKNGEGSALLLNPHRAEEVVRAARRARENVTVKMRLGFSDASGATEFAKRMEGAGAQAITVHGRTREQYYSGKADRDAIAQVVKAVKIPVIANGDVWTAQDYKDMLENTGAAGVMIARGALGNPNIFAEISGCGKMTVRQAVTEHMNTMLMYHPPRKVCCDMKKHIACYLKGVRGAKELKLAVFAAEDIDALREIAEKL